MAMGIFLLVVLMGAAGFFATSDRIEGFVTRQIKDQHKAWQAFGDWWEHTAYAWRTPAYPDFYTGAKWEPREGVYLGAYVVQDGLIGGDMAEFNRLTGKQHATFFRYVGYGQPFPEEWVGEVAAVGAVPQIAWEPNDGLDAVVDGAYLREFARRAGETGIPIFLRYASEMNGNWTVYSDDPELYIEKWRLVHDVMEEEAPNVAMVWTVFTMPQSTIKKFYPGDEYVDWVGVNVYNVAYHNNRLDLAAAYEDPLKLLDYVYQTYADRKPIMIAEYGVTHYTITDEREYVEMAIAKLTRMYRGLLEYYPRVKAIYYFDVNNVAYAAQHRQINDYSLTSDPQVLAAYRELVHDPRFLSSVP